MAQQPLGITAPTLTGAAANQGLGVVQAVLTDFQSSVITIRHLCSSSAALCRKQCQALPFVELVHHSLEADKMLGSVRRVLQLETLHVHNGLGSYGTRPWPKCTLRFRTCKTCHFPIF